MRMAWPFTVNALLFASGACVFPFFVLYYQSLGFSGTQIGLLTGITPLINTLSACRSTAPAGARPKQNWRTAREATESWILHYE